MMLEQLKIFKQDIKCVNYKENNDQLECFGIKSFCLEDDIMKRIKNGLENRIGNVMFWSNF